MKKMPGGTTLVFLFFFVISACVTINIYFPAAAVEKAADRIVEEVWGEESRPEEPRKQGEPESFINWMRFALDSIGPGKAYAQEADINVTTPAIRALKDSIKERAESIKPYMDNGNAGLSNEGLLTVRSTSGLSLKDKAALTRLIEAENTDRKALYREIAKANNFPPDRISDIMEIFAKSWAKQAKKGWWVQGEDDEWSRK